jgi:hypothetical protein
MGVLLPCVIPPASPDRGRSGSLGDPLLDAYLEAQAGHACIESTRIYLHLADDWLASQYRRAAEVIDAQVYAGTTAGVPPRPGDPARP